MSEQQDVWAAGQQGMWQNCPRYGIMVAGCSRYFVCLIGDIQTCLNASCESKMQNHSRSNNVLVPSRSIAKTHQIFINKGVKILGN